MLETHSQPYVPLVLTHSCVAICVENLALVCLRELPRTSRQAAVSQSVLQIPVLTTASTTVRGSVLQNAKPNPRWPEGYRGFRTIPKHLAGDAQLVAPGGGES